MRYLLLALAFVVGCAEFGGGGAGPQPPADAGGETCELPEPCEECETCETCEECEECPEAPACDSCCEACEECPECPEPPVSDPCECFETCDTDFETQKCLSDMMRAQGMCTQGHHYDVRFWCKIDGNWRSEKTWVYPCDEDPWYEQ